MNASVSVLVPTFNRACYIEECLDSILAQTVAPAQVIVVDDGSTDSTPEILRRYAGLVTYLRKDNGGKASAVNHGLRHVSGEYVWIFDDDDMALPDSIERRLQPFAARSDVDFVYSSHILGRDGPDGRIVRGRLYELPDVPEQRLLVALLEGCFFEMQGVLAHRRCYEVLGWYDESFLRSQDYDMLIRMAQRFHGVAVRDATFVFRKHEGLRGPMSARHASSDRDKVWIKYERIIGKRIREELPLEAYVPEARAELTTNSRMRREAYLQRMTIMASKGLDDEMVADLLDAIAAEPREPLDSPAAAMCRRAIILDIIRAAFRQRPGGFIEPVRPLRAHRAGRDALRAFSRGMFWVARRTDLDRAMRLGALRTSIALLWSSLG